MQKHERAILATIRSTLGSAEWSVSTDTTGHSCMKIVVRRGSEVHFYVCPATPASSGDQAKFARQWARRVIRGEAK